MMKVTAIVSVILIAFAGCLSKRLVEQPLPMYTSNCPNYYDTVPISKIIKYDSYYWKKDSCGCTGFRRLASNYLSHSKILDANYDLVLQYYGNGIYHPAFLSDKTHLYLVYFIFNTNNMGERFKQVRIEDKIIFEFDPLTKKMRNVRLSVS